MSDEHYTVFHRGKGHQSIPSEVSPRGVYLGPVGQPNSRGIVPVRLLPSTHVLWKRHPETVLIVRGEVASLEEGLKKLGLLTPAEVQDRADAAAEQRRLQAETQKRLADEAIARKEREALEAQEREKEAELERERKQAQEELDARNKAETEARERERVAAEAKAQQEAEAAKAAAAPAPGEEIVDLTSLEDSLLDEGSDEVPGTPDTNPAPQGQPQPQPRRRKRK
jgi:hypothetical protein